MDVLCLVDLVSPNFHFTGLCRFNEDSSSKKSMLSHYDDPTEHEVNMLFSFICLHFLNICVIVLSFTYQGVTLDEGGRFTGEAEKKLEEVIYLLPHKP